MEELFEKFADAGEMWSNEADLDDNPLSKKYKTTGINLHFGHYKSLIGIYNKTLAGFWQSRLFLWCRLRSILDPNQSINL